LPWGALGAVAAAAALLLDTIGGPWGLFVPLFLVVSSVGFVSTNALAGGLAVDPSRAGTVSALFGAAQFAIAGLTTTIASTLSDPADAMALMIALCTLGAAIFPLRRMTLLGAGKR
jgi:DHA1 family bicyclomycin/chloramphenicol resistance-like MFS transporter